MDQHLDNRHQSEMDGTGMYPLIEPISLKTYFLTTLLPAAVIQALSFLLLEAFLKNRGLSDLQMVLGAGLPSLLLATLYVILTRRDDIKKLGTAFFTRYELGRRMVIGIVISWGASFAFVYFAYYRWQLAGLTTVMLLLVAALVVGNLIIAWISYELASYILFGVLTWLVSVISFSLTDRLVLASPIGPWTWSWLISKTVSFILAVLFAFVTNRMLVFTVKGEFWRDLVSFFSGRILTTLVFEYGTLFVMVNLLSLDRELANFVGSFLVTIANYFVSKYLIFTDKQAGDTK